jgi:hypothetical protein
MKNNFNKFKFFFLTLLLIPFFVKAEQRGIGINKTIFSFEVKAGEEKDFSLNVKNLFPEEEELQIETGSFEISGNNNQIVFLPEDNEKSINSWFILEETNFKLQANEEKNLSVKMKIPAETKGGSYQGVLFFKIVPKNLKDNSVNESGAIGVQFLINVLSDKKIGTGEITYLKNPFFVGNNLKVDFGFKNLGNFYYVPRGELRVKNLFTRKEQKKVIENHFVFPNQEFNFSIDEKGFFWLGLYKVELSFIDGDGKVQQKNNYFWGYLFFPLIIFVVLVIFFLLKFFKKKKFGK